MKFSSLSNTLFYQLVIEVIRDSIFKSKSRIIINERYLDPDQQQILANNGFYQVEGKWRKAVLTGLRHSSAVVNINDEITKNHEFSKLIGMIKSEADKDLTVNLKLQLERSLWPVNS